MFNNLFGSELDLTVGQFQVSDPLFKRELRLTCSDYYIYKIKQGTSLVDLAYDRRIVFSYEFESGTRGGFKELVFRPNGDESKWYAVALYNYVNLENHLLERVSKDVNSLAVHFGYLLKRNIRLTAEYSHDFNNKYGEFGLGFVTAF